MLSREKALFLLEKAEKGLQKELKQRAKDWVEPLQDKNWSSTAEKEIVRFTNVMEKVLQRHRDKLIKALKGKKLFKENVPEEVEKAEGDKRRYKADDYLDRKFNLVIVDDVRDILREFHKEVQEDLQKVYQDELEEVVLPLIVNEVLDEMKIPFNFNKYDEFTRDYLKAKRIKWAKQVDETTERVTKRLLVDSFEDGLDFMSIANRIKDNTYFGLFRAEKIARTEIISSCNYADYVAYNQNDNIVGYTWHSFADNRVRSDHRSADNQYRDKGKPFTVGGEKLMHPGDNSLGASAKNVINCRCFLTPVFKGEKTGKKGA